MKKYTKTTNGFHLLKLTVLLVSLIFMGNVYASPPSPDLLKQVAAGKKTMPYFITHLKDLHAQGICSGKNPYEKIFMAAKGAVEKSPQVSGVFKVLAILVQFSDHPSNSNTIATYYDSLLFDTAGITVRDYYRSASYGQLDIVTLNLPSSMGWIMAPHTYAYYVNGENGTNPASYPNNTQGLVEDLVDLVDPSVDFSQYDNDGDGLVDVLVVIHAGQGAEKTGSDDDIWSHKWGITPKLTNDGVYVSKYTIQPEYINVPGDMTIGVFAHELGHAFFGLPDLYDIDYSSKGIGKWGIMGYGSWLGPAGNGGQPAFPCAWSRIKMGFNTPINISTNVDSQAIDDIKTSGEIYRLWTSGNMGNEYFLVDNRQKTSYDTYLPGSGLLIWHIDDSQSTNNNEWYPGLDSTNHYLVALEQADGLYELEHNNDLGDNSDVFPGSFNATSFNAVSAATSNSYTNGPSFVAVENISSSASTMYADLKVAFGASVNNNDQPLPTTIQLSQNYPNPFNPTTNIDYSTSTGGMAKVEIYNLLGQKVETLLDSYVNSGNGTVNWDGSDEFGNEAASGIYFYKLELGNQKKVKKMVLMR